jgi:hypothetical protein
LNIARWGCDFLFHRDAESGILQSILLRDKKPLPSLYSKLRLANIRLVTSPPCLPCSQTHTSLSFELDFLHGLPLGLSSLSSESLPNSSRLASNENFKFLSDSYPPYFVVAAVASERYFHGEQIFSCSCRWGAIDHSVDIISTARKFSLVVAPYRPDWHAQLSQSSVDNRIPQFFTIILADVIIFTTDVIIFAIFSSFCTICTYIPATPSFNIATNQPMSDRICAVYITLC